MCLGLVRSDSDCGREQKVKPKVAIIYLITDPLDTWRMCWNTHFSHSFCILPSFLSRVSLSSFTNTSYANSEKGALIGVKSVVQNKYDMVQQNRTTAAN